MTWSILLGDARERLRDLAAGSVHCIVTSPPYWGLRDYGVDGQVGLENSLADYVGALVAVFGEARRVLRDDGTLWLNLGDSYVGGGGFSPDSPINVSRRAAIADGVNEDRGFSLSARQHERNVSGALKPGGGLKAKDLVGLPWVVAFALRDAGWWLRAGIVWHKPYGMPEAVSDRVTTAHEFVFHMAKSSRYYYDADAIRTPLVAATVRELDDLYEGTATKSYAGTGAQNPSDVKRRIVDKLRNDPDAAARGANARSVWSIGPEPSSLPHFATMPTALARRCIRTGCPPSGVVLDPFAGIGTTLIVALEEGRSAVGVELNPEFHAIARSRCAMVAPLFAEEGIAS